MYSSSSSGLSPDHVLHCGSTFKQAAPIKRCWRVSPGHKQEGGDKSIQPHAPHHPPWLALITECSFNSAESSARVVSHPPFSLSPHSLYLPLPLFLSFTQSPLVHGRCAVWGLRGPSSCVDNSGGKVDLNLQPALRSGRGPSSRQQQPAAPRGTDNLLSGVSAGEVEKA